MWILPLCDYGCIIRICQWWKLTVINKCLKSQFKTKCLLYRRWWIERTREWILCWNWSPEGLTMLNDLITFCPSLHRSVEDALEHIRGRAQPGLCSYGQTTSCCLGWRNVNGICQRESFCDLVTAQLQWHTTHSSQVISSISAKQQILGNKCQEV